MGQKPNLSIVSDDDLLRRLSELLGQSRRVEADLVAHIAEVDARRLYAREATPSMFAYCTERLHLSEPEAYLRIAVARASRRHPTLLAEMAPLPEITPSIRKLPARRTSCGTGGVGARPEVRPAGVPSPTPSIDSGGASSSGTFLGGAPPGTLTDRAEGAGAALRPDGAGRLPAPPPGQPATIEPVAPARFRVRFDASAEFRDKGGRRCTKRHDLEFHHREPFGQGGGHSAKMLCLMCRTHNMLMAEQDYGTEGMARFRRSESHVSEPAAIYGVGLLLAGWGRGGARESGHPRLE